VRLQWPRRKGLVTRFLVTGADGFVGTHLVAALRSAGHAVTGTSIVGGPDTVACDVRSASAVTAAVRASVPERVVHLAAQSSAARSWRDPALTYEVNVTGTHNLLESLRREAPGARVLLACTSDQYGAVAPADCPLEETAPLRPLSPYAASKVAAEWVGRMFCSAFALQVVITRAFMHVGPGQPATFATADWARQIALAEAGTREPVLEVGNLDLAREYGDVRDVVDAYLAALESADPGEPYNVATGDARPLREVVAILTGLARVEMEVRVDPSKIRPADPPVLEGSAAKLRRLTGWRPRRRLEDTLAEVLEHWRKRTAEAVVR
jgi:GDP-4-dehydro-6-deoxy-D-mannose reductase